MLMMSKNGLEMIVVDPNASGDKIRVLPKGERDVVYAESGDLAKLEAYVATNKLRASQIAPRTYVVW